MDRGIYDIKKIVVRIGKQMKKFSPLTYFNNQKLGTKMLFAFIVGAIVPIVLTQIISYSRNVSFMTDKGNELTVNNLNQISKRTDLTLEVYTNLLYQVYVDDDVILNINKLLDDSIGGKAEVYNKIFNRLKQYNIEEKGVRNISIICNDGTTITYDYETGSSLYNLWNGHKDMREIQPYVDAKDKIGMVISPTMKFVEEEEEKYFFIFPKEWPWALYMQTTDE